MQRCIAQRIMPSETIANGSSKWERSAARSPLNSPTILEQGAKRAKAGVSGLALLGLRLTTPPNSKRLDSSVSLDSYCIDGWKPLALTDAIWWGLHSIKPCITGSLCVGSFSRKHREACENTRDGTTMMPADTTLSIIRPSIGLAWAWIDVPGHTG